MGPPSVASSGGCKHHKEGEEALESPRAAGQSVAQMGSRMRGFGGLTNPKRHGAAPHPDKASPPHLRRSLGMASVLSERRGDHKREPSAGESANRLRGQRRA